MLNLLITPDFPPEFFANWHMFNTQVRQGLHPACQARFAQ